MEAFIRRNVVVVLAALLFLASLASLGITQAAHARSLEAQQQRIAQLNEQLRDNRETASRVEHEVSRAALGVDPARVEKDTKIIEDLLERTMNWSSYEEYEENRTQIAAKYKLSKDASYLKAFLPPSPVTVDGEGKKYPYIDAVGLNSTLSATEVEITGTKGPTYDYAVMATVSTESHDEKSRSSRTSPVFVTINGNGQVEKLEGYAASTPLRQSN